MNHHSPPVTVLMPAYNAGLYIREAIDSVLQQTFTDFELLIVNDGSTDDTEALIRSYSDPRIRIFSQENQGVTGALNRGLQLARGKYIARFDADDICYPDRLAVQYDFMEANPGCVLLGGASDYIDKDGHYLFEWQPSAYESEQLRKEIRTTCPFDHPTVMYVREVALEAGGYPQGAIHFEDHLFWTRFFDFGTVANLSKPLIRHRFNPGSVTIDEKWRGPEFKRIKYTSVANGYITEGDAARLKEIVRTQDVAKYKDAAYYTMIAKKYLWNRHEPFKARLHLHKAIGIMPLKAEPYLLYLLSFLPGSWIRGIYRRAKS